jgi:hypothetical protein
MVVHVVDMGDPSPEDFSISRSSARKVASLEEVRLNRDAFPDFKSVESSYSECAFASGWVQL